MDLLSSVKNRLDRINPAHIVQVIHEDNMWIGVCDELGLVTESGSYEELTERVWEIAPDLCACNSLDCDPVHSSLTTLFICCTNQFTVL